MGVVTVATATFSQCITRALCEAMIISEQRSLYTAGAFENARYTFRLYANFNFKNIIWVHDKVITNSQSHTSIENDIQKVIHIQFHVLWDV